MSLKPGASAETPNVASSGNSGGEKKDTGPGELICISKERFE